MMYLEGNLVAEKSFYSRMGTLCQEEYQTRLLLPMQDRGMSRVHPMPVLPTPARDEARRSALRLWQGADHCRLRDLAAQLGRATKPMAGPMQTMRFDFAEEPIVYGRAFNAAYVSKTRTSRPKTGLALSDAGLRWQWACL